MVTENNKIFELSKYIDEKIGIEVYYIYCLNAQVIQDTENAIRMIREQKYGTVQINDLVINLLNLQLKLNSNLDFFQTMQTNIQVLEANLKDLVELNFKNNFLKLMDCFKINLLPILYQIQEHTLSKIGELPENRLVDPACYNRNLDRMAVHRCNCFQQLQRFQEQIIDNNKTYRLHFSSTGHKTLEIEGLDKKLYLHSARNVMQEANEFAAFHMEEGIVQYYIYGFGLGYHTARLIKRLPEFVKVHIFESDINIIRYAFDSCNLSVILESPSVQLVYDPEITLLEQAVNKNNVNTKLVIHLPSFHCIQNDEMKQKILELTKRCSK